MLFGCSGSEDEHHITAENVKPGVAHAQRALETNWEELLQDRIDKQIHATPLAHLFQMKNKPVGLVHQRALRDFYQAHQWQPIFLDDDAHLNFRASAFIRQARNADAHGLRSSKYLRPDIARLARKHAELHHALQQAVWPKLGPNELLIVKQILKEPDVQHEKKPLPLVLERLFRTDGPTPELGLAWKTYILLARAYYGTQTMLELTIADAWLDWAYDMQDGYWEKVDDNANEKQQDTIRHAALVASMTRLANTKNKKEAEQFIESKVPHYEQYTRLLDAYKRYQEIVADGGWPKVETNTHLKRGRRGPIVKTLKERLQIEGYYDGPIDDNFDVQLDNAVKSYQQTHQIKVDGESSAAFWSSLNVSAQDRLDQIHLTLQRWRETRIGNAPRYILINIPDFHAEVWNEGKRDMRFRIVVGNTIRECRNNKLVYVNETPIQSAPMNHVILNPYWTVPQRITEDEILPAYLKDPEYLIKHNYEEVTAPNGYTMIRQLPGPNNALGKVKFMFPNAHHTYLHDTPRKVYFNADTRAFSHGCMRVQDPIDLLKYLLTNDGDWTSAQIDKLLKDTKDYRINLENPIPVISEYYVVRVDDEGHVNFLADLYRHDRERLELDFVREPTCEPPKTQAARLKIDAQGNVLERDPELGEWVDARQLREMRELEALQKTQQELGGVIQDGEPSLPSSPPGLPIDFGP